MLVKLFGQPKQATPTQAGNKNCSIVIGPSQPAIIQPEKKAQITIGPAKTVQIVPPPRSVWDERGWVLQNQNSSSLYSGQFRVIKRYSRLPVYFAGRIQTMGEDIKMYIANPPVEIRFHPKGPCFIPEKLPWFRLHWHHPAHTVDDAILYMERILAECIGEG